MFFHRDSFLRAMLVSWLGVFVAAAAFAQPSFSNLQPADGAVLASGQGTLTGQVTGADTLTIDGQSVTIDGGAFSYSFDLGQGQQVIQLVADGAGGQTATTHSLTIDTLAPAISVSSPSAAVVADAALTVAGTATDPHLASVTVNGAAASLSGGAFSLPVTLVEGAQTLTIRAEDSLGHASVANVDVTLDSVAPVVTVTESGAAFAGGLFNRPVAPVIAMSDATELTSEIRLDGSLFVSGDVISSEGAHTLTASATDAAGWVSSVSIDFTLDLTPPTLGTITPATGTVIGDAAVILNVEAPGASEVRAGGVSITGATPFTLSVPLVEGRNDLIVEAFDDAGNRVERLHRLDRDSTTPALSVATPSNGDIVSSSPIRVAGTATDQRLQEVRVNGLLANLVGTTFEVLNRPWVAVGEDYIAGMALLPEAGAAYGAAYGYYLLAGRVGWKSAARQTVWGSARSVEPDWRTITAPAPNPGLGLGERFSAYRYGITNRGIRGDLGEDGFITFTVKKADTTPRGGQRFNEMMAAFDSSKVRGIRGMWSDDKDLGDNFRSYKAAIKAKMEPEEAAFETFTGKMAKRHGFTKVRIIEDEVDEVLVEFMR